MDKMFAFFKTPEWTGSLSTSLSPIFLVKNQPYSYISGLGLIISVPARHFEDSPPSLGSAHRGRWTFCELGGRRKQILLCFSASSLLSSTSLVWGPFSSLTRIVNLLTGFSPQTQTATVSSAEYKFPLILNDQSCKVPNCPCPKDSIVQCCTSNW